MFIVLDAIDGAGKGRQRIEVLDYFSKNTKLELKGIEFPVHNVFYESVIHPALQEETTLNQASWILAFLLDKTLEAEKITPFMTSKENLLIADGYFTTTIAYQSKLYNQVTTDKLLEYAEDFDIPKPDLAIFLDTDPDIAFERKEKEEGHEEGLDMNEKDINKQRKLQGIYQEMANKNVYCNWEVVDGNGTIEHVKSQIVNVIKKYL